MPEPQMTTSPLGSTAPNAPDAGGRAATAASTEADASTCGSHGAGTKQVWGWLGVLALSASALVGGNASELRDVVTFWKDEPQRSAAGFQPRHSPPLDAMNAPGAEIVAQGSLYQIDKPAVGRVILYRLADGTYALRLEDYYIAPSLKQTIKLSRLREPRSTEQLLAAPSFDLLAPLSMRAGSVNFVIPSGDDPTRYHSVVVWSPLENSAYAAATLVPTT